MAEGPNGMDLATLGLRIDAREFRSEEEATERQLKKLDEAGRAVEDRMAGITRSTKEAAEASRTYGTALETEEERHTRIARQMEARFQADERQRAARQSRQSILAQQEAAANAVAEAKARADALERQFRLDLARIKEGQARQFITPQEAGEAGRQAAREFNQAIVGELDRSARTVSPTSRAGEDVFIELGGRIKNVDQAAQQASTAGLSRLNRSLASVARQAAGAHPAIGQVGYVLSSFAVGTAATTGILAGVAAIGFGIRKLTEDFRENREAVRESIEELERLRQERELRALGPGGELLGPTANVRAEIERLEEEFRRVASLDPSRGGVVGGALDVERLRDIHERILELRQLVSEGEAEIGEERDRAAEEEARRLEREAEERRKALEEQRRELEEFRMALAQGAGHIGIIDGVLPRLREQREEWRAARREVQRYREALGLPGVAAPITGGPQSGDPHGAAGRIFPFERVGGEDLSLRQIDQATRSLIGLADTAGILDGSARDAARGLSDLLGGLEGLRGAEAGFGQVLGALGVVSGVVGVFASVLGDGDRAEEERRRLDQERNALLRRNQATLEAIARRDGVTAAEFSATSQALEALQGQGILSGPDRFGVGLLIGQETGQSTGINPRLEGRARAELEAVLGPLGIGVEEFFDAIRETGIDFFTEDGRLIPESIDQIIAATRRYREEVERLEGIFVEELEVRRLFAQGRDEEAKAARRRLQEEEEIRQAREAGFSEETIAALEAVQAEERLAEARREATQIAERLRRAQQDLTLGPLSALNPVAAHEAARKDFELQLALALGGDATAAAGLPSAAQAALQTGQGVFASGPGYASLFDFVTGGLGDAAEIFEDQANVAQQALEAQQETSRQTGLVLERLDETYIITERLTTVMAAGLSENSRDNEEIRAEIRLLREEVRRGLEGASL